MRGSIRKEMVVDSDWSMPVTAPSMRLGSTQCRNQNCASSRSVLNAGTVSQCLMTSIALIKNWETVPAFSTEREEAQFRNGFPILDDLNRAHKVARWFV